MEQRHDLIADPDNQQPGPAQESPGQVDLHPIREVRQGHPAKQGRGQGEPKQYRQGQGQGGQPQGHQGGGDPAGANQGQGHGGKKEGETEPRGQRPRPQHESTAAEKTPGEECRPQAQQEMGPGRDRDHPGDRCTGDHRQHLEQGAAHDLAEKADGQEMSHRQGGGGPTRGQRRLPLDRQDQPGGHGEPGGGQKEPQRQVDGRGLIQAQARGIDHGVNARPGSLARA